MSTNDPGPFQAAQPEPTAPVQTYPTPPHLDPTPGAAFGAPLGAPPVPPRPTGGKGFAVTALVLALVALALSWIPIINNLAAVLAVVGLVFGVVALVGAVRRGRPGKGMAITAIAIALVSFVVVITTQIAYGKVIDDVVDEISSSTEQIDGKATDTVVADDTSAEEEPAADPAPTAQDLASVDLAFGQRAYDPTTWWYVAIVDNPNTDFVFPFAEVTVEAIGADGTILDSSSDYLDILPGRAAVTGMFLEVGANTIDHLEIRGPAASEAVRETELGTFAVSDVSATSDDWSTTVGGNLSSAFEAEQTSVRVTVVATAPDGHILGAELTFVDRLPSGGQARFEVMFLEPLPADTTYTAYPSL